MLDYWIAVVVRDTRKICPWGGRPMKGAVSLRDTWVIWGRRPKKAKTTIYCTATVCWILNTHHPHPDNNPSWQCVCGMCCRWGRGSIASPRAEQCIGMKSPRLEYPNPVLFSESQDSNSSLTTGPIYSFYHAALWSPPPMLFNLATETRCICIMWASQPCPALWPHKGNSSYKSGSRLTVGDLIHNANPVFVFGRTFWHY